MDFRTELAKWGYNKGNSIDVEILIDEILSSLFSKQEKLCDSDIIQKIRNSLSDAEARRIIRETL